jgi:lysozyme
LNLSSLKTQLVMHEGLRLSPYKDSVGKLTIGVGRNLDDVGISESEAMALLENDIRAVLTDLDASFPWWRGLSETRQLVMADMCFNLGISRLKGFKRTLEAMQARAWFEAASEMRDSKWARQVGKRAETLANMMEQG